MQPQTSNCCALMPPPTPRPVHGPGTRHEWHVMARSTVAARGRCVQQVLGHSLTRTPARLGADNAVILCVVTRSIVSPASAPPRSRDRPVPASCPYRGPTSFRCSSCLHYLRGRTQDFAGSAGFLPLYGTKVLANTIGTVLVARASHLKLPKC